MLHSFGGKTQIELSTEWSTGRQETGTVPARKNSGQAARTDEALVRKRIANVQKIAVLRANSGLGDLIFIFPALAALRATYPHAEIALLALNWHADFLGQRPSPVDRVIVVPPYGGVSAGLQESVQQADIHTFFQAMHREKFDFACQFHGGGHFSNPFVKQLGARTTVGLKAEDAEPLDRWIPYCPLQSEYHRYLEVASLAGATWQSAEPHIHITERDSAEAGQVLPETIQPLAVLHAGARDPGRRWPAEKFARVGDVLAQRGLQVVLTGAQNEHDLVESVAQSMQRESLNLCGRLSLGGLAALLARSRVVVSNDSGPLHLAHAVGTRTVGIYWCYNFVTVAPVSRLHHMPLVSWQVHCPVCGCDRSHNQCLHTASLVSSISIDEVLAATQKLIGL